MRVAIVSFGTLPVPAVRGGAVENLIENIVKSKEIIKDDMKLTIYSIKDKQAELKAKEEYQSTRFEFISINKFVKFFDLVIYHIIKFIFPKKKTMSFRYIMQRMCFIRAVGKCINKEDYDLIIFENHVTLFHALKYKNNFDKYKNKYCYHIHNEIHKDFGSKRYMLECPLYIGVSEYTNKTVDKHVGRNLNFKVLKNCIDQNCFNKKLEEVKKREMKRYFNIPYSSKIILFTGRLSKEKGIIELLNAFNKIKDENLYLMVVGSQYFNSDVKSNFELQLQNLANAKKDKIIFTGYIEYSDIWKYYKLCDIVVLPSMWDEPCALTVVESIVTNSLLITTYSGGIPEYVDESCAILLKRDNNIEDNIKNAVVDLLNSEKKAKIMRENMLKRSKNITIENYYKNFYNIINEFINKSDGE